MLPAKPKEENSSDNVFTSHSFTLMTDKTIYIVECGDYAASIHLDVPGEEKTVRKIKRLLTETGIETTENKCDTLSQEQLAETPH